MRPRFENGPNPIVRITLSNCAQGFQYCCRMVRKVIVNADIFHLTAKLKPAFDTFEGSETRLDDFVCDSQFLSGNDDAESILNIERSQHRNGEITGVRL